MFLELLERWNVVASCPDVDQDEVYPHEVKVISRTIGAHPYSVFCCLEGLTNSAGQYSVAELTQLVREKLADAPAGRYPVLRESSVDARSLMNRISRFSALPSFPPGLGSYSGRGEFNIHASLRARSAAARFDCVVRGLCQGLLSLIRS